MERLTKHDSDIGYYVDADMANQEATSNIDVRNVIQGEAITKLAELENMIEEGDLLQVVRCMDCINWVEATTGHKYCDQWSTDGDRRYTSADDYCSYGDRGDLNGMY